MVDERGRRKRGIVVVDMTDCDIVLGKVVVVFELTGFGRLSLTTNYNVLSRSN